MPKAKGRPRLEADPRYPSRVATREARKSARLETPTNPPNPETLSTEAIGIADPQPALSPTPPIPEPDTYHCQTCSTPIVRSDTRCPLCEIRLDWQGVK